MGERTRPQGQRKKEKEEVKRPSFDEIYMRFAQLLARRSTCQRAQVGCVVVTEDNCRVLAVGYNGNYHGGPNGCDSDEPGSCGCLHSEENAFLKLNYNEPSKKKLYTTTMPCKMCAKRIIQCGVSEVIYHMEYRLTDGVKLLERGGVAIRKYQLDPTYD